MASSAVQKAFIKEIAPHAQAAYKALGKVYPSICIAMACVESGYGTSSIMRKYNAFLGQKVGTGKTATIYWDRTFFVARTKEEYTVGTHTVIKDAFRSYVNMRQCVMNYYELLNSSVYKRVMAGIPYQTQMQQIKACGYMTSSTEVNSVLNIISRYDLTKYDDISNIAPVDTKPTANVKKDGDGDVVPPTIRRGSENKTVKLWQTLMNIAPSGIFDLETEEATRQFQMMAFPNEILEWDGIVGKKTWNKAFEGLYES